jgi:serine protease AprX
MKTDKRTPLRIGAVVALVAFSALGLKGANSEHRAHLSLDLLTHQSRHTDARTRVIVHGSDSEIDAIAGRHHLQILRRLAGSAVLAANSSELSELAADSGVDHLSGDLPVHNWMSVSNGAMAADQARAGSPGLLGLASIPGVTGQGIGVAVIDSGIAPHSALANAVVASVSMLADDASTSDEFGHGTHVAGIIAGAASPAAPVTKLYTGGIAPGAQLVNVRVLGADGSGLTSDVVAGIDWAVEHRTAYNIRVINLSLGHSVTEPCATDPLCEAVARASMAGIVVVAAAGNNGMTPDGHMILGGVTSPGNSPFAITVGAVNTAGTVNRNDDTITSYSSRGPTKYDFTMKPDVAAPGNKIVSLEAAGSYLATNYPSLHRAGWGSNAYMQLSGTSMAAPMVSGAIALLLQGTPGLSPAQVKLALQMGATYMPDAGLVGAGAGSINVWASRKIAAGGLTSTLQTGVVGNLTSSSSGAAFWDAGTLSHRLYTRQGFKLLSAMDALLAWLNPSRLNYGDLNLLGLTNKLAAMPSDQLVWGPVAGYTRSQDEIIWGTSIYDNGGDEIIWGTSDQDEIIWGSTIVGDDPH